MRILAIGLGGAGGRIVNHLYRTDRRSSKVACVQALTVDIDLGSIDKLTDIPENSKVYFPPLGVSGPDENQAQTAIIDIAEIAARAQTMSTGETDAVFLVMGLGGSMADDAAGIITTLRSTMTEPIFALVTLPCLSEGARCSSKAADQIEMISPLVDGVILFDNETWQKKVKITEKMQPPKERGFASKIGLKKKKEPAASPTERMHSSLNDVIVRRISLILRAGEFRADGGLDLAEVVLDAGEVLNTMKGMGFITIGYAVEQLPSHPLDFLTRLRPGSGFFADEHQKKASRIIDLAKQAIYHEISAPCDITSAHKALILVAGPSHELSMKGYMTVRKWIDRSIAGLETRSGDYPVMSTRFVAIIVMLTGLGNVPRIAELKEIRAETRAKVMEAASSSLEDIPPERESYGQSSRKGIRDEMISLPSDRTTSVSRRKPEPSPERSHGTISAGTITGSTVATSSEEPVPAIPAIRPFVKSDTGAEDQSPGSRPVRRPEGPSDSIRKLLKSRPGHQKVSEPGEASGDRISASELERRKIEEELQRQRQIAIGGAEKQEPSPALQRGYASTDREEIQPSNLRSDSPQAKHVLIKKQPAKKIIIHKKSSHPERDAPDGERPDTVAISGKRVSTGDVGPSAGMEDHELLDTWIQQVREQKKIHQTKEDSGTLTIDAAPAVTTRDDALVHTSMKRERKKEDETGRIAGIKKIDAVREIEPAGKKRNRTKDDEDISFVK